VKEATHSSFSLLWRILLSTSIAITLLFGVTGWMVQSYANSVSQRSLQEEVKTSLEAYRALWAERARNAASVSKVISSMSDVRSAFQTRDSATIRDVAGQVWAGISAKDASFLVLDPVGNVIASLGGREIRMSGAGKMLTLAREQFPEQCAGYVEWEGELYYVVLTPVYVQAGDEPALLNVLLVALNVNHQVAEAMKRSTNGSEFAFLMDDKVVASSLPVNDFPKLSSGQRLQGDFWRLKIGGDDSLLLETKLPGLRGWPAPELFVIRSFAGASDAFAAWHENVALIWLGAMCVGIALTYLLAKRILRPVEALDRAAGEVIRLNYDYRVPVETGDELGRLAATFNTMCESIKAARLELITRERIATVGRLAASIVHDLRNPLAAIYGGAEMLVDSELSSEQQKRLAGNIYRSSRQIKELLQELLEVSRAGVKPAESSRLIDIVNSAADSIGPMAQSQNVTVDLHIDETAEVLVDHDRLVRVFLNIMNNSLDAMPGGGVLKITDTRDAGSIVVHVEDTGAGIDQEVWPKLFQPFASYGKKNGLGLGLALSRHTVSEHNGELWADRETVRGARFHIRLPLQNGTR
jgi:signal transduction histidine kinase